MKKYLLAVLFVSLFAFLFVLPLVCADTGPHVAARLEFYVTQNGSPIAGEFRGDILQCWDADPCEWKVDTSDICADSVCEFGYYRVERVPRHMVLQITLADNSTFSSDPINFSWSEPVFFYNVSVENKGLGVSVNPNPPSDAAGSMWDYFVYALVFTIVVELLTAAFLLKRWKVKKWARPLWTVALMDVVSLPLVWAIFYYIVVSAAQAADVASTATGVAETFAVVFEAFALFLFNRKALTLKRAFWMSLWINAASFIAGLVILEFIFTL